MHLNPNNEYYPEYLQLLSRMKEIGKERVYEPSEHIMTEGGPADFMFFIEEGIFRTYRWFQDREVTSGFTFKDDADGCPYSLIHEVPSKDYIQALVPSKVIITYKRDFMTLDLPSGQSIDTFLQLLLTQYIETLIGRITESKVLTAETRYLHLLKRSPEQVSQLPLSHLASFLGISQERLSRIRKKYHLT
ncbi:MAG: Crp/Fnr family transcriptional regulator [Bacteroidota bacterium]